MPGFDELVCLRMVFHVARLAGLELPSLPAFTSLVLGLQALDSSDFFFFFLR